MTDEELAELDNLDKMLQTALVAFSVGHLGLNLALAVGLKYLWNMVALL